MKFVPLFATALLYGAPSSSSPPLVVDGFQHQIGLAVVPRQQDDYPILSHQPPLFASSTLDEVKTVAATETKAEGKTGTKRPVKKNYKKNNNGRTNNNKNKRNNGPNNNKGSSSTDANNKNGGSSRREYNKRKYLMKRWKSQQADQKRKQQKELVTQQKKDGTYTELVSAIGYQPTKQNKKNYNSNKKTNGVTKQKTSITPKKKKTQTNKASTRKTTTNTKQPKKEFSSWSTLEPGSTVSGKVIKLLPYGALVQIPYDIPGKTPGCVLLHQNQIPKNNNKSEEGKPATLKLGQRIDNARVLSVNRDKGTVNISLLDGGNNDNMKRATPVSTLQVGDEILGKVVRLKQYGAFVDIGLKRNALLHLSRMSMYKVTNITDFVKVGEFVKVRVLKMGDGNNDGTGSTSSGNGKQMIAVSMLSKDNDAFVDRRDLQRKRMAIWDTVVTAQGETQLKQAKMELLEIDRQIWEDFMVSAKEGMRKSGEV